MMLTDALVRGQGCAPLLTEGDAGGGCSAGCISSSHALVSCDELLSPLPCTLRSLHGRHCSPWAPQIADDERRSLNGYELVATCRHLTSVNNE